MEQSRGQTGSGDAYSPGWFELPLPKGANVMLVATAEPPDLSPFGIPSFDSRSDMAGKPVTPNFRRPALSSAARQFVVRRGEGKTVIAGYPWFLDWGRDSLICLRAVFWRPA